MDINIIRGIQTALLLVLFVGLVIWVYSKKRKSGFDEAANLPFLDDPLATDEDNSAKATSNEQGEKQ